MASPVPKTRVEKGSDKSSHSEADADGLSSKSKSQGEEEESRPSTPGGRPIPRTMVEESSGPSSSGVQDDQKHQADTAPDVVMNVNGMVKESDNGHGSSGMLGQHLFLTQEDLLTVIFV